MLGFVALLCTIFAPALIYTQSFMNDQSTMGDAIFFFRFFAMQIVFYGISTIVSGLLNASRDYLWSSAAPIFNNIIVTVTFVAYAFVAPSNPELAKFIIAVGNPLGVFMQMAIQLPALRRNGIKLRPHVNLHDPAIKETLSIGVPAVVVMTAGLVIVSVQNSAAYGCLDNGPSIIAYARLWFTLPYAFLTVPITTTMFTEISHMIAKGDTDSFKRGVVSGSKQILFFMLPFMLYLIVFAEPLVTLYHIGAFTQENIWQIASYLIVLSISLPFYAVNTYLQKAFSALRAMKPYSGLMLCALRFADCVHHGIFNAGRRLSQPRHHRRRLKRNGLLRRARCSMLRIPAPSTWRVWLWRYGCISRSFVRARRCRSFRGLARDASMHGGGTHEWLHRQRPYQHRRRRRHSACRDLRHRLEAPP